MAYEKDKDKLVWEEVKEFEDTKVGVGVYKYADLPLKIQISRQNKDKGGWVFSKLGRLSKEELTAIMPLLKEALEKVEG